MVTENLIMFPSYQYPTTTTVGFEEVYQTDFSKLSEHPFLCLSAVQDDAEDNYVDDHLSPTIKSTSPSSSDLISMPSELSDSRGSSFNGILVSDPEHSISDTSLSPGHSTNLPPNCQTIAPIISTVPEGRERSVIQSESHAPTLGSNILSRTFSEPLPISSAHSVSCQPFFPPEYGAPYVSNSRTKIDSSFYQQSGSSSWCIPPHNSSPAPSNHMVATPRHFHPSTIGSQVCHIQHPSSSTPIYANTAGYVPYGSERTSLDNITYRVNRSNASPTSHYPRRHSPHSIPADDMLTFKYTLPSSSSFPHPVSLEYPCTLSDVSGTYSFPNSEVKDIHAFNQRAFVQAPISHYYPNRQCSSTALPKHVPINISNKRPITESYLRNSLMLHPDTNVRRNKQPNLANVHFGNISPFAQIPHSSYSKRRTETPITNVAGNTKRRRTVEMRNTNERIIFSQSDSSGDLLPHSLLLDDVRGHLHEASIATPTDLYPPTPMPLKSRLPMAKLAATCVDLWKADANGCPVSSNKKYTNYPFDLHCPVATKPADSDVLFGVTRLFDQVLCPPNVLTNNFLVSTLHRLLNYHGQVSNYSSPPSPRASRTSSDDLLDNAFTLPALERSTTPPLAVIHRTSTPIKMASRSLNNKSLSQQCSQKCTELVVHSDSLCCANFVVCSQCEMQIVQTDKAVHLKTNESENRLPFCSSTCLANYQKIRSSTKSPSTSLSSSSKVVFPTVASLLSLTDKSPPVLLHQLTSSKFMKEISKRGIGRRRQSNESGIRSSDPFAWVRIRKRRGRANWRRAERSFINRLRTAISNSETSRKQLAPTDTNSTYGWHLVTLVSSDTDSAITDTRTCHLCHQIADASNAVAGRLLNYDMNIWIHLNCILWCYDVYETIDGGLEHVTRSLKKAKITQCSKCGHTGAGLPCFHVDCSAIYHLPCAHKLGCVFLGDRSMFCPLHREEQTTTMTKLDSLAVERRVFICRDEDTQVAKVILRNGHHTDFNYSDRPFVPSKLRVGSLILHDVGQLLPEQLSSGAFHNMSFIYPVGYSSTRIYWSYRRAGYRCYYHCHIDDSLPRYVNSACDAQKTNDSVNVCASFVVTVEEPSFPSETFSDISCDGVWQQIMARINQIRCMARPRLLRIVQQHMQGEALYGLTEPHIIRAIESLPGVDRINNYAFKFNRLQLIREMPLAINPTGCARSEPKLRTHVRNRRTMDDSGDDLSTSVSTSVITARFAATCRSAPPSRSTGLCSPLSTSSIHPLSFVSKSQQYRRLQADWRSNVVLARSRIQGLGLYAARDMSRTAFIIEYLGELIRNEVGNRRERLYQLQNRGIYMFRADDDLIVDATMCGGLARYVNHSCEPNCTAEVLLAGENGRQNSSIIIVANREIETGEELTYDYKLEVEEDGRDRIPCLCGAPSCRNWMN